MRSIRARLTLRLLINLLLVFALLWLLSALALKRITDDYLAARLHDDAEAILAAVSIGPDAPPALEEAGIGPVYQRPFSGFYFRVETPQTTFLSRSLWDFDWALPEAPTDGARSFIAGPQDQHLLALTLHYRKGGVPIVITVAADLLPLRREAWIFQSIFAGLAVLALAGLAGLHWLSVRHALQPLESTRADLARLEAGGVAALDERVPEEVQPLVREINRLLRLLAERLRRSRNMLGNLAHALKSPLTELGYLARSEGPPPEAEERARAAERVEEIRRLIERELRRARLAGERAPGAMFHIEPEIDGLVEVLARFYHDKGLAIERAIPSGFVLAADREDLLELIGNLLDNACKWARARVRITVANEPGFVCTVEDDGPGVPAEALARLSRRGTRLDEQTQGHGLGLAIAHDIVGQYKGRLTLARSQDLGGFLARIELPAPVSRR